LSDPLLDVRVYEMHGVAPNCDQQGPEVTSSSSLDINGDPALWSNTSGTLNLTSLLVQSLLDPNHTLNASYGGYTTQVELEVLNNLVNLGTLPVVGASLDGSIGSLQAGTTLPAITMALSSGVPA